MLGTCLQLRLSLPSQNSFSPSPLSLTIRTQANPFLLRLLHRFTNLTSLKLTCSVSVLNELLVQISRFILNLTSLDVSLQSRTFPANGMQTFRGNKIITLTTLILSNSASLDGSDLLLIAYSFPNLQRLDLKDCRDTSEEGIVHLLRTCCNITHLNLTRCSRQTLSEMNFEISKLEVLNLSRTSVDDKMLLVISNSCRRLLQLILCYCSYVTEKGVRPLVENCPQLREINVRGCYKANICEVLSMVPSRPPLREITYNVTKEAIIVREITCRCYGFSD